MSDANILPPAHEPRRPDRSRASAGQRPAEPAGQRLHDALSRCMGQQSGQRDRLSYVGASVLLRVAGADDNVRLLLDESPPRLVAEGGPADIEIELSASQADAMAAGRLNLPRAVATGTVATLGPVRRYLEVDAILRCMLADEADAGDAPFASASAGAGTSTRAATVGADLLALEARGLCKRFGSQEVLAGVDLAIPEGVISVVLGPSGTGKSVLLKHIIGLLRADEGEVLVRGRSLNAMSSGQLLRLRREVGVMFQDGALFSTMNVFDNVAFPLRQHTDLGEATIAEIVRGHLAGVGLADAWNRYPSELSGGMRKRAGLARAMVLEPGILLVDEPDSGLDPVRTALLGELLVAQHDQYGGTMVVVTHNVALAKSIADHISVLWNGGVLESGFADDVMSSDSAFVRQFLAGDTVGPLGMDA